jgi:hypothetical protein
VHLVETHPVVETCHDQLLPHDVSTVHADLVPTHFVLVPEEDQLVLVSRHQNGTQNQTHANRFLVVGIVLDNNIQRIALKEQASRVIADEDGGGLEVQKGNGETFGFDGEVEDVRG